MGNGVPVSLRKHAPKWVASVGLLAVVLAMSAAPASAQTSAPTGRLDVATPGLGQISVQGWTFDPDTPTSPALVHVYVDGAFAAAFAADQSRPDVGAAFPASGDLHGFSGTIAASAGTHFVCAYGINTGSGDNTTLPTCRTIVVLGGDPFGSIDSITFGVGSFTASGWAIDPDTTDSIDIHAYVDGVGVGVVTANAARPDVAAAIPGYGDAHGFGLAASAPSGVRTLCLFAINSGAGVSAPVGGSCRVVTIPSGDPIGSLDFGEPDAEGLWVDGWTIDPDGPAPTLVHIYVDGQFAVADTANIPRPDVGAAFPGFGDEHGFETFVPASPGSHQVCAYAINATGPGGSTTLGCRTVQAWSHDPVGSIDEIVVLGGMEPLLLVAGWAIDPDTTDPVDVELYVDGVLQADSTDIADWERSDLAATFPSYGPWHGYILATDLPAPGFRSICVKAVNLGAGATASLGCYNVLVPNV